MPRELPSDFEIPDDAEMDDGDAEDEGQMDEDGEEEEELDYETFSRDWTSGDEEEEEIDDDEGNGWEEGLEQDPEPHLQVTCPSYFTPLQRHQHQHTCHPQVPVLRLQALHDSRILGDPLRTQNASTI